MQGCMYSLKIVSSTWYVYSNFTSRVPIEQRFKIEAPTYSLLKEIPILYRSEKDIYVDRFSVNNVNKFLRQHFDQLFQIHI